jgi:MoaA/NifB/PqqE/SkfB family radical SAM enzyme
MSQSLRIIGQGSMNWMAQRPIVVSFEVTDSCTCFCRHCDHGGQKDDSRNLKPADYRRYMETLQPVVVQISGGEPLMRDDLTGIVRQVKQANGLPYILLVSSWTLMTEERYLELREAGVDQFNVSLDFPDARHDDFRGYPGLYAHLSDLVPRLGKLGYDDIVLNSCITAANAGEITSMANQAREWGVNICYSAYSARRTGCRELFPGSPDQLERIAAQFAEVENRRDESNWVVSAPTTLEATYRYFSDGGARGCMAGLRFLVVTADGKLQPCSMHFNRYELNEQARMVAEFTRHNQCDECYVAIRSNLDKSFPQLLAENVKRYFSFGSNGSNGASAERARAAATTGC